jgi:hypothetical protein
LRHQQQKYRGEEPARCPSSGRRCCASDGETNVFHYYFNGPDRLIKSVTHDAVIRNFLKNEKVAQPLQYIQYPAHAQRKWMPAWFYVDQTGSTVAQISRNASFVAPCRHRSLRKETAFRHSTGKAGELRSKLLRTATGSTGRTRMHGPGPGKRLGGTHSPASHRKPASRRWMPSGSGSATLAQTVKL